jgi:hypothetical protein
VKYTSGTAARISRGVKKSYCRTSALTSILTARAISNAKLQQGASAAAKAAAAAQRRDDNAALPCNSDGGSAEPLSWLVDSDSSKCDYRDSDSCTSDSDGNLDSATPDLAAAATTLRQRGHMQETSPAPTRRAPRPTRKRL